MFVVRPFVSYGHVFASPSGDVISNRLLRSFAKKEQEIKSQIQNVGKFEEVEKISRDHTFWTAAAIASLPDPENEGRTFNPKSLEVVVSMKGQIINFACSRSKGEGLTERSRDMHQRIAQRLPHIRRVAQDNAPHDTKFLKATYGKDVQEEGDSKHVTGRCLTRMNNAAPGFSHASSLFTSSTFSLNRSDEESIDENVASGQASGRIMGRNFKPGKTSPAEFAKRMEWLKEKKEVTFNPVTGKREGGEYWDAFVNGSGGACIRRVPRKPGEQERRWGSIVAQTVVFEQKNNMSPPTFNDVATATVKLQATRMKQGVLQDGDVDPYTGTGAKKLGCIPQYNSGRGTNLAETANATMQILPGNNVGGTCNEDWWW